MRLPKSSVPQVLVSLFLSTLVLVLLFPTRLTYGDGKQKYEIVAFNTKTFKYHCLECTWAKKCTVNCVNLSKSEAIRRGGVPCKVCGGSCRKVQQESRKDGERLGALIVGRQVPQWSGSALARCGGKLPRQVDT